MTSQVCPKCERMVLIDGVCVGCGYGFKPTTRRRRKPRIVQEKPEKREEKPPWWSS